MNNPERGHVRAARSVSLQSAIWTVLASCAAVVIGVMSGSAALGAFGAIGFVDAIGSIALVYHFHHGLRHDELSDRLEDLAHRVVIIGLFIVGLGAILGGLARLVGGEGGSSDAGTVLAAISLIALVALSLRKRFLARQVLSPALLADGRLSAVGAMQAGVTLFGAGSTRWFGWDWADAFAAILVGSVAVAVAVMTWRASKSTSDPR